jgi:hypothetical protein
MRSMNMRQPRPHYTRIYLAGNHGKGCLLSPLAPPVLNSNQLSNIMAAKKTAKKTTESAPKEAELAPKKTVAKKAAKKAPAKKAAAKKAAADSAPAAKKVAAKPSLDAIARAAYLNYRRRVEQGLPGDSHGDWLEAERKFADPG